MWAGRSNTLVRVAVISFLFAAAPLAARGQPRQPPPPGQKPEQQQQNEGQKADQNKTPAPQADPQQATDKGAQQKGSVPAANGRATSLDAADGPRVQVADDTKPVIVHSDMVTLTVTVTDTYGRFVTGLNKNAFSIVDDKTPQEITFFSDRKSVV